MADSSKEQIEIAKELLNIAKETQKVNREQSDEFSKQLRIMQELLKTIQDMKKSGFDDVKTAMKELGETTSETKDEATKFNEMLEELEEQVAKDSKEIVSMSEDIVDLAKDSKGASGSIRDLSDALEEAGDKSSFLGGMWSRMTAMFSGFGDILKGIGKGILTVVEYAFKLGAALVNVAVSAFQDFMEYAQDAAQLGYELARAIEKVRQNFGDLTGDSARAVTSAGKSMAGFAETGLSAFQVFGSQAQQMEAMNEMAMALGGTFFKLTEEVEKSGGAMLAFQKGLGLSNEAMKGVASLSITTGKSFKETAREIEKFAIAVAGKSFKPVSRAIGEALKDVAHFGGATIQQIAQAAKYAHTLGVELDKIVGTLDAFETFDSAADNAARLSQSFGITVDAFKLMEAQSPDEIINNLREQFAKAGVDASTFNRQQLKMISSMTGLDAATAKQVFSLSNQGESLDKIKQKGDAAAKTQLTQQEAMKKLSESIERLVIELPRFEGLFDAFFKGLVTGLFRTGEGQKSLQDMMKTFQKIFQAGIDLGQFIANIPAVKEFFHDIGTIILNLSKPFEIFSKNFKLLFEGKQSFAEFWTNVGDQITNAFSKGEAGAAFGRISEKLRRFAVMIAEGFGSLLNYAFGALGSFFDWIADWLSGGGPTKALNATKDTASDIGGAFWKGLSDPKNLDRLSGGFNKLMDVLGKKFEEFVVNFMKSETFQKIKDIMIEGLKDIVMGVATYFIGLKIAGTAFGLLSDAFASKLFGGITNSLESGANKGTKGIIGSLTGGTKAFSAGGLARMGAMAGGALATAAAGFSINMMNTANEKLKKETGGLGAIDLLTESLLEMKSPAKIVDEKLNDQARAKAQQDEEHKRNIEKFAKDQADTAARALEAFTSKEMVDKVIDAVKRSGRSKEISDSDFASFNRLIEVYKTLSEIVAIMGALPAEIGDAFNPAQMEAVIAMLDKTMGTDTASSPLYKMLSKVSDVGNIAGSIQFSSKSSDNIKIAADIITSVKNMMEMTTTISELKDKIPSDVEDLTTKFGSFSDGLIKIVNKLGPLSTAMGQNGIGSALAGRVEDLGKIVKEVNNINNTLKDFQAVDVVAKVGQIATSLGVGGKGEYRVTKGDVNLTVNFTVVMDVDKTEKVMIMRKESVIRDRLNDAQTNHMSSEYEIPDTYSPSTKLLISDIQKAKTK